MLFNKLRIFFKRDQKLHRQKSVNGELNCTWNIKTNVNIFCKLHTQKVVGEAKNNSCIDYTGITILDD